VLLDQFFNSYTGVWQANFIAGAGNVDGFPAGTYYSLQSATQFST
jgi:hypothetical protein